jgi:hypothetical protein
VAPLGNYSFRMSYGILLKIISIFEEIFWIGARIYKKWAKERLPTTRRLRAFPFAYCWWPTRIKRLLINLFSSIFTWNKLFNFRISHILKHVFKTHFWIFSAQILFYISQLWFQEHKNSVYSLSFPIYGVFFRRVDRRIKFHFDLR